MPRSRPSPSTAPTPDGRCTDPRLRHDRQDGTPLPDDSPPPIAASRCSSGSSASTRRATSRTSLSSTSSRTTCAGTASRRLRLPDATRREGGARRHDRAEGRRRGAPLRAHRRGAGGGPGLVERSLAAARRERARLRPRRRRHEGDTSRSFLALAPDFAAAPLKQPDPDSCSPTTRRPPAWASLDAIAALGHAVPRPRAALVGEPTGLEVADAHKGVAMCDTRVTGRRRRLSHKPRTGASAVQSAACDAVNTRRPAQRVGRPTAAPRRGEAHGGAVHAGLLERLQTLPTIAERRPRATISLARAVPWDWEVRYVPIRYSDRVAKLEQIGARPVASRPLTAPGGPYRIVVPSGTVDRCRPRGRLPARTAERSRCGSPGATARTVAY